MEAVLKVPGGGWDVVLADGTHHRAPFVLAGCAPYVLDRLRARPGHKPQGSQTKINLVLRRLPRFASGIDPATGFAGTLHLHQSLPTAAAGVRGGGRRADPGPAAGEVYCHTLTDDSILGPAPRVLRLAHADDVRPAHAGASCSPRTRRGRGRGSVTPRCARCSPCWPNRSRTVWPATSTAARASR